MSAGRTAGQRSPPGGSALPALTRAWPAAPTPVRFGLPVEADVAGICDPATTYTQPTGPTPSFQYSWTSSINLAAGGPLDPAVVPSAPQGLYYINNTIEPGDPGTLRLDNADPSWTWLIKAGSTASAYSTTGISYTACASAAKSPTAPVLAATRANIGAGKGRVALWPMLLTFTLLDGYSPLLAAGVVMDSSRVSPPPPQKSEGHKIASALLDWLAQPSLANTTAFATDGAELSLEPPGRRV